MISAQAKERALLCTLLRDAALLEAGRDSGELLGCLLLIDALVYVTRHSVKYNKSQGAISALLCVELFSLTLDALVLSFVVRSNSRDNGVQGCLI